MNKSNLTLLLTMLLTLFATSSKAGSEIKAGLWKCNYDRGVNISYQGTPVARNLTTAYALDGKVISSLDYRSHTVKKRKVADTFGKGYEVVVSYTSSQLPRLIQTLVFYPHYLLTRITVSAEGIISTNYMAPMVLTHTEPVISGSNNRMLFVPYDNDAWIRFRSVPVSIDRLVSYEVTATYDANSRKGVVIGALNHNHWKNAVELTNHAGNLRAYSGVADSLTRDTKPHGFIKGKSVESATFMLGLFDDWRDGMETFADLNVKLVPSREWTAPMPVGWNSWGALQFNVNHDNAVEVSDYIASHLQNHSFCNADGLTYVGLDSGWDSFSEQQLADFAKHCEQNHQVPCIYWTPFTDWGKDGNRVVPGSENCHYKDIWLYANSKPQELDGAYAIDPTHPAVRKLMELTAEKFRRCGYKYVKMDFMTHGRMEADRWYDKRISTGTEAYNYGMHLLDSIFSDMYINLSISPIFPSQYAQSRRIACDAWNKIKDTEYTLNALSFGWWVGHLYDYNDADHVVLRDATEGENRARITSSIITGIFILGDDFSLHGDSLAKSRAESLLTHPDINALATGVPFRPLEASDERSEHCFYRELPNGDVCVAVFNYTEQPLRFVIPYDRLGLKAAQVSEVRELWTGQNLFTDETITVPGKDVRLLKLLRKSSR